MQQNNLPTSFKIRPRAIERLVAGKPLTRSMSGIIYRKYIKSPEWQVKVKQYRAGVCELCGGGGKVNLHHLTYKHLMFETQTDLATLCDYCHLACHIGIVSLHKLRNPSHGMAHLVNRKRNGLRFKRDSFALFLRRRWIAKYGDKETPPFLFFRQFYLKNICGKEYPWGYSVANL